MIRYKITVKSDPTKCQFDVIETGDITTVRWLNKMSKPFTLAYQTSEVIRFLKEGRWKKVSSKTEIKKNSFLSPNLFSFDDI
jgi:hypothetical protein